MSTNLQKCIETVDEAIGKFLQQADNFNSAYRNFRKHKSNGSIPKKESRLTVHK